MRRFFQTLLLALILQGVALVSALTAMRFAIHGREVTVPKLVGMTPLEAERAAVPSGLQVIVERQFYSAEISEGRILSQVPSPGVKVRRGWSVRVAQSLGPQRVTIPEVAGDSERVAELNIRRRGLDLGSIAQVQLPDSPADQVVSQNPPANASGVSVPKINLLVSNGPMPAEYVMPNFVGQPLGSVTLALQDAGIKVGKVTIVPGAESSDNEPSQSQINAASMIVSQTPARGQKIVAGGMVSFEVH